MGKYSSKQCSWRNIVLDQLIPGISEYFVVEDPDQLMTEPGIQTQLQERDCEFYPFDNSVEFRHFYELKVRHEKNSNNVTGHSKSLVISIDTEKNTANDIPFDIYRHSKKISLSLSDCFPDLYQDVLTYLDPEELDALEEAISEYAPGKLGSKASSDFILRHIYQVAPEVIQTPADLLRTLLRIHYRDIKIPLTFKKRLTELLSKRRHFQNWPLDEIINDSHSFFHFLQSHWPAYIVKVHRLLSKDIIEPDVIHITHLQKSPGIELPFGHDDVKIYIDNLFIEGYLTAIEVNHSKALSDHWSLIGIQQDTEKEIEKRITGFISLCREKLPEENARHQMWLQYAPLWAELSYLHHTTKDTLLDGAHSELVDLIDDRFKNWMLKNYNSLHNNPPTPPVMLNHIPKSMAREIDASKTAKVALILIDGLALDQWVTLRNSMSISHDVKESSIFAWVPSITSVSRQALFSAKAPFQFAKTINTTSSEPKAWDQFWVEQGLDKSDVFYRKSLGTDDNISVLIDELSDHRLRAAGLVINTVDDIMHGMKLGSDGMHNQIKLWGEKGYLSQLINALIDYGFTIHLTSDHGNVEALGCGKISEGAVAESRGERARIYKTEILRDEIYKEIDKKSDTAVLWPQIGLPVDYWPVVMSGREAFVAKNQNIVGHGGIAIEEVIVPYIRISKT